MRTGDGAREGSGDLAGILTKSQYAVTDGAVEDFQKKSSSRLHERERGRQASKRRREEQKENIGSAKSMA